ncbi:hypothetical protein Ddye_026724 [Dipteronia dyeriana]|uniref:TIR domain-containing protein n=1 Tax=Dipteronia dyeriana TaxID=168575 RepID=A0AAD9TNP3_9ROSI|nr:hypothetical protein Ddye_026724 [Dipteronia dyeriana]
MERCSRWNKSALGAPFSRLSHGSFSLAFYRLSKFATSLSGVIRGEDGEVRGRSCIGSESITVELERRCGGGEDTRLGFTSHLYEALRQKKIATFIDNQLIRGDEISPALLKAIEESSISVVIFLKDYASSKWCLCELERILECQDTNGQIVIPVFYHVDPSDVRKQAGSFEDAFVNHENVSQEEKQRWRAALTRASNLSGWDSSVTWPESRLVDEFVKDVLKKLSDITLK